MNNEEMVQKINDAEYSLIAVEWKGTPVFVKVRELSDLQIQAIGNLSLINTSGMVSKPNWKTIIEVSELQHLIVKAALVYPTYDQCFELIGKPEFAKEAQEKFIEIEKEISDLPRGPEKQALEKQCSALRILFDFILPNDFTSAITEYILGSKRTEIKLVTNEILLNCAVLQQKSGGRPSDYCTGNLSEFNKRDIDISSYNAYEELKKRQAKK